MRGQTKHRKESVCRNWWLHRTEVRAQFQMVGWWQLAILTNLPQHGCAQASSQPRMDGDLGAERDKKRLVQHTAMVGRKGRQHPTYLNVASIEKQRCYNFTLEQLLYTFYSWLQPDHSDSLPMTQLLQAQSALLRFTVELSQLILLLDYSSHDYSALLIMTHYAWLITLTHFTI